MAITTPTRPQGSADGGDGGARSGGLAARVSLGRVFDFPYRELHPAIERLVERLGSDRLMWGTDMPNVERFCNYRQTLDTFRVHCRGVISDTDIDNIVGLTAARTFGLEA